MITLYICIIYLEYQIFNFIFIKDEGLNNVINGDKVIVILLPVYTQVIIIKLKKRSI